MRVLFVNRMASMVRGGGETFDMEIARHLEPLGCEVSFLTGIPFFSGAASPLSFERSYTIRTPYTGWFRWDRTRGGWRVRLTDFWIFEQRAAAWAAAHRTQFDVVQVCELPVFVNAWKKRGCRQPVVVRLTAPDYYDKSGGIRQADAVIASGDTMRKVRSGARPDCFDVPNGVDDGMFRPHETNMRGKWRIDDNEFVVLCVARFQAVKNHKMLLNAFAQFLRGWPRARLVLAGSGPLESDVRTQCAALKLGEHVMFLGEVPFAQLPDMYAACDLSVIPSFYESFCFAALEAMASGLPLAVTDTDWVPELIGRDRGGIVVPKDDAAALAEAMLILARDPAMRVRLGTRNREEVIARWGWESSARKLLSVYETLIQKRNS